MKSRFFSSPLAQSAIAVIAVVVLSLSLSQVRAQDLDEAIDEELDSSTQLESSADMEKADDLEDLELDDEPASQSSKPAATPAPAASAQGDLEEEIELDDLEDVPEEKVAEPGPVIDEPLDLDPEPTEPQPVVAEPMAPEPTIDEPNVEEPIVSEPATNEPPPAIAKEPPPANDDLFDAPNTAFEKRLHDIVRGVRSTDDGSWDDVVGDRRAEIYPVQAGDTLWDLSQTFFGDGFFWGKLWSENGTIENPHDIAKGRAIRFVAGSEDAPPAIGVAKMKDIPRTVGGGIFKTTSNERPAYREDVEGEITLEEVESGIALETAEIIPAPTLPPPSKRIPLLKDLPASFLASKSDPVDDGFDLSGIKGAPAIRANDAANVILSSYAVDREPETLGKVDEIEASERFAGVGQYVILRLNRDVKVGMRVTFAKFRPRPSGAPGPIVDVRGVGTITGIVNENRNAYRALVTTSLDPVDKDAVVLEEAPPLAAYSKDGPRGEADVKVLGADYDNSRRVIGLGSVVYLSGGSKAGLREGEILGVMSMRESRFRSTRYPNAAMPIATIRVVDVREKVATAIVLENGEYITIGDRTSGEMPSSRPPISTETAAEATAFGARQTDEQ